MHAPNRSRVCCSNAAPSRTTGSLLYNVFADNSSRGLLGDDLVWLLDLIYTHSLQRGRKADWDNPDWPMLDPWGRGHGAGFLLDAAMDGNHPTLTAWLHGAGARPDPARVRQRPSDEDGPASVAGRRPARSLRNRRAPPRSRHVRRTMTFADLGHSRPFITLPAPTRSASSTLLIARGAEVDPRESNWNATPLGFAIFGERRRAIECARYASAATSST